VKDDFIKVLKQEYKELAQITFGQWLVIVGYLLGCFFNDQMVSGLLSVTLFTMVLHLIYKNNNKKETTEETGEQHTKLSIKN